MNTKRCFGFVIVTAIWALVTPNLGLADSIFNVNINTTALVGNASGPFQIDFQLNDGSGTNDGNNTATVTGFAYGGGGAPFGAAATAGGASGSLSSTVTLTDNSFFNNFQQSFTAGSTLAFIVDLTTNIDAGPTPDAFTFAILDNTGSNIPTTDTLGGSLVTVNINSATPTIQTFAGATGTGFAGLKVISAPVSMSEPGTLPMLITGLGVLLGWAVWKKAIQL